MYKLIIGNVRITVAEDNITREQATAAARQALNTAHQQGKMLSHIEISLDDTGLQVFTEEKAGYRSTHKTIKQSMLDDMYATIKEKFYPTSAYTTKDSWFDNDTGQEWRGAEVDTTRSELLAKFESWTKTV